MTVTAKREESWVRYQRAGVKAIYRKDYDRAIRQFTLQIRELQTARWDWSRLADEIRSVAYQNRAVARYGRGSAEDIEAGLQDAKMATRINSDDARAWWLRAVGCWLKSRELDDEVVSHVTQAQQISQDDEDMQDMLETFVTGGEWSVSVCEAATQHDVQTLKEDKIFSGHTNIETIKDVGFYGTRDEYVVSGSDGGRVFVWARTGTVEAATDADGAVCNVAEGHPWQPVLATAGIDSSVKLLS